MPDDSHLLYSTGLIHYRLDDLREASVYIRRAMENATLRSDINTYKVELEALRRKQMAGA